MNSNNLGSLVAPVQYYPQYTMSLPLDMAIHPLQRGKRRYSIVYEINDLCLPTPEMAEALCGPTNALQHFSKHTTVDRTLQQDRLVREQPIGQVSHFRKRVIPSH